MAIPFLLAALVLAPVPGVSGDAPATDLAAARAAFAAADADRDRYLTLAELRGQLGTSAEDAFAAGDADRDGRWSRDEFTVQFRAQIQRAGGKPAADLEAESVRILALRRTRTEDEARARGGPAAGRLGSALVAGLGATPEILELDARIDRALLDLEDRAAGRGAVRADFDRVRTLWNERVTLVRKLDGEASQAADPSSRLLRALDLLQARAQAGSVPRAQFADLRSAWGERPRRSVATTLPASAVSVEVRFSEALTALEQRATQGRAGRTDFDRVRELLPERARRTVQGRDPALPATDDPRVVRLVSEAGAQLARLESAAQRGPVAASGFRELRALFDPPAQRPPAPSSRDAQR